MKNLYAKFRKGKPFNTVEVAFPGTMLIFSTVSRTKKKALGDIKKELHKMVDEL